MVYLFSIITSTSRNARKESTRATEHQSAVLRSVDVEDLLAGLLGALAEIVGDFLLEVLFGLAAEALSACIGRLKQATPAVSAIGLAFVGAAAGLLSVWLVPHRLIVTRTSLPGVSLLLAPLVTGFAMGLLGKQLRRFGQHPSDIATFRGGVVFAFSMAVIRWWLVGMAH